ncbi:hypothetical protein [Streptomyces sp. NPDC006739]|uniref:hypothetical protein n=1 Tax=Streptomyces sp. NPDC006739 TaxID=3364763 RepID=UPI0036CE8A29
MPRPVLLLGAGRDPACGEFPLAGIAAVRPVLLVDAAPPAWARPFLAGHLAADPGRGEATAAAVTRYAARHAVRGVLTLARHHLVAAARIAGQLGLPGVSPGTAAACADRAELRSLLSRHRVPLADPWDPEPQPGGHDTPVDPRISAETVVLDGEVRITALTRTTLGPPPARQPLRHTVHAHDGLLHNPFLRQTVERTVRATGISRGVLHIGLCLTARGPRVTDVAAHLPGDLIPLLVKRATGVDLARAAAELATGQVPDVAPTRQRAAAIQFAYPAVTGHLAHLDLDPAAAHEPYAERMVLTQHVGNPVTAGPSAGAADRLAHWVAVAETPAQCEHALRRMARHLSAAVTPLARTPHAA